MAISQIPQDLSFMYARTGSMKISSYIETIMGICQRLFNALPERDIYNKNGMGLNVMARSNRAYHEGFGGRDKEYEKMVYDQFIMYTDIKPSNVIVYYHNEVMRIIMDGQYGNFSFQMRKTSDPKLATEILPKTIRGI